MTPTAVLAVAALGVLALAGVLGVGIGSGQEGAEAQPLQPRVEVALPATHHGRWQGPNRLWIIDPNKPERSDGTVEVADTTIRYSWARGDKKHQGTIELAGQPEALRCDWHDDFHATDTMSLHGFQREGIVHLYGTYPAGDDQPEWGWQIELDTRDREAFVIRMFNVVPGEGPMPAVVLHASR